MVQFVWVYIICGEWCQNGRNNHYLTIVEIELKFISAIIVITITTIAEDYSTFFFSDSRDHSDCSDYIETSI